MDLVLITVGHHFRTTQKSIRGFWQNAISIQYSPFAYFQSCFIVFAHKIMYSLGFWFLVITVVTRETENSAPANVWGGKQGELWGRSAKTNLTMWYYSVFAICASHTIHGLVCPKTFAQPSFFLFQMGRRHWRNMFMQNFVGKRGVLSDMRNVSTQNWMLWSWSQFYTCMHMFFTHVS